MSVVTNSAYLSLLRDNHPHGVLHYMSIYEPQLVYVGTVTGSPARGARAITVSSVSGNIALIRSEDSVYIGSSVGDSSKGIKRLKSVAGQVLTLAENSVDWSNGDYISVYHDMRLWGIWPRIEKIGTTYVFYKDYDDPYTDENLYPTPVAVMGWHRSKFLDGATVSFVLNATLSYAIAQGAGISSYLWECDDGYIANPTASSTTITFATPGQYEIQLTVTDSNGKSQTTRRIYWVHDRPGSGAVYPPYIDFELSGLSLNWTDGGGRATFTLRGDDLANWYDNTLVSLWGENYFQARPNTTAMYSGTAGLASIINDGNFPTKFCGYLFQQTIAESDNVGKVDVDVCTIDALLKKASMASVSLTNVPIPSTWYHYYKLTVTRAIHHYWMHHSNLLSITDVILPQDDSIELFATDDLTEGSLYQSADVFGYQHGIFVHVCSDKYGRLHLSREVGALGNSDRNLVDTYFSLGKTDVRMSDDQNQSSVIIVRDTQNRVSLVTVRGTSYSGGVVTPLISQAPGEVPESGDGSSVFERIVLSGQTHANVLSGRLYYIANRKFVELRLSLAGNYYDILDIVPQRFITIENGAFSNLLDKEISGRYVIVSIDYRNAPGGVCELQLILEPDVDSVDGVTIAWPSDPQSIVPPTPRPPRPPTPTNPPTPPPSPIPSDTTGLHALASVASKAAKTDDISATSPTWTVIT